MRLISFFKSQLTCGLQESTLLAALRHPNICQFLGVCPVPPCLVTEYCARGSLADLLRAARASPARAAQLKWPRRLGMVGGWVGGWVGECGSGRLSWTY